MWVETGQDLANPGFDARDAQLEDQIGCILGEGGPYCGCERFQNKFTERLSIKIRVQNMLDTFLKQIGQTRQARKRSVYVSRKRPGNVVETC
jgi:hypothetical protein